MNLGAMRMAFAENVWDPAIRDGVFEQMQMPLSRPASRIRNYNRLWQLHATLQGSIQV